MIGDHKYGLQYSVGYAHNTCNIGPEPTTCTPTDSDCSATSDYAGGYGLTFHGYFSSSSTAGKGGAAAYCPKGTLKYADCDAACSGESKSGKCVACCKACCTPGVIRASARTVAVAEDDLVNVLRAADDEDLIDVLRAVAAADDDEDDRLDILRARAHRQRGLRRI